MPEFTLPPLPYAYDALEPHIDTKTMQIHHDKHHQAYVTNLNAALKDHPDLDRQSIEEILRNIKSRARGDPPGGDQQRRRARQPHAVLGDHGPRAAAASRPARSPTRSTRPSAASPSSRRKINDAGVKPLRQRLGVAGAGRRQARRSSAPPTRTAP